MDLGGVDSSRVIVLDAETTGVRPGSDEVLSVSIIDGDGKVLFDELIRPEHRKRWPKAQEINGISPEDVSGKKTLLQHGEELLSIVRGASVVVGFNVDFDLRMLEAGGLELDGVPTFDVMREYSRLHGGKWPKLSELAAHYGYDFEPHSSLADVRATLYCYRKLLEEPGYAAMREEEACAAKAAEESALREQKAAADKKRKRRVRLAAGVALALVGLALVLGSCSRSYAYGSTIVGSLLFIIGDVMLFTVLP